MQFLLSTRKVSGCFSCFYIPAKFSYKTVLAPFYTHFFKYFHAIFYFIFQLFFSTGTHVWNYTLNTPPLGNHVTFWSRHYLMHLTLPLHFQLSSATCCALLRLNLWICIILASPYAKIKAPTQDEMPLK